MTTDIRVKRMHTHNLIENNTQIYISTAVSFELGQIVMTRGMSELLGDLPPQLLDPCLFRHKGGDWGNICQEDREANDNATRHGLRVMSEYTFSGERIWLITEADRSATTFLLPSEY